MKSLLLKHTAVAVDCPEDFDWFDRVDRCLGPKNRRYLGTGYKRVRHTLVSIAPGAAPSTLDAIADIHYPEDWSQKEGGARSDTHVSTVDNVLLSARLVEALLGRGLGLTEEEIRAARVISVAMSFGASPITSLRALPCLVRHLATRQHPLASGLEITTAEVRVGTARTVIQVEHPTSGGRALRLELAPSDAPALLAELNDGAGKLYGDGYVGRDVELTDIVVDKRARSLSAIMRLRFLTAAEQDGGAPFPWRGIGAADAEAIDVLDLMLSGAQLGQILIYGSLGLDRNRTGNLWMREFTARCAEPIAGLGASVPLAVSMDSQQVTVNDATYAVVNVTQEIPGAGGVHIAGSFALQL